MSDKIRANRILKDFQKNPTEGISCYFLDQKNINRIEAKIVGAKDCPYEGGIFKLSIQIPDDYPFSPPIVLFKTRIFHPNIDERGNICLDTLKPAPKGAWKPILKLRIVLLSIRLLMSQPNPDDALLGDVAEMYRNNYELFFQKAKDMTELNAKEKNEEKKEVEKSSERKRKREENKENEKEENEKKKRKIE